MTTFSEGLGARARSNRVQQAESPACFGALRRGMHALPQQRNAALRAAGLIGGHLPRSAMEPSDSQRPRKRALSYTEMMNSGQQRLTDEPSQQPVQPIPQDSKDEEAGT